MNNLIGPAVEVKMEMEIPRIPPKAPAITSPIKIGLGGKISVKGTATPRGTHSKVSFSAGTLDAEQVIRNNFGTLKLKEQIRPGQVSKISVEVGMRGFPVNLELAANADFTRPFSIIAKWPAALKLRDFDLSDLGFGEGWTFTGTIEPQVEFSFAPNELWPGWIAVIQKGAYAAKNAGAGAANFVRGVYFAGECGQVTVVGAGAVAAGAGALMVAWVASGLYLVGRASRDGATMAVRYAFSNGYAQMLADLTSDSAQTTKDTAAPLLAVDWKTDLSRLGSDYVNGRRGGLGKDFEKLGNAAVLQDADKYIASHGAAAWEAIRLKHQQTYGVATSDRRHKYLQILYDQVKRGDAHLGIAL